MTELRELPWVGMDVDAELARYEEEDRRRAAAQCALTAPGTPARSPRGEGGRAPFALMGKESPAPLPPLAA
jgi:hypothetical protein